MTLAAPVPQTPTSRPPRPVAVTVLRWLGRLMALCLLLFWGAFFVEHVREWFIEPKNQWPPAGVWGAMAAHLGMLVGLAAMLRWERVGAAVMLASTAAFLLLMGVFVPLMLVNAAPVLVFAVATALGKGPSRA